MAEFWMELRAVDSYKIKANGILSEVDFKIITMLYQPLVGADCLALYQTFFTEIKENRLYSDTHAHTQLLNLLAISLERFFEARLKLEGLGLLKTYRKKEKNTCHYLYELFAPLSAQAFFSDGLLNFYLYSKVGKRQYLQLKAFFTEDEPDDIKNFQDITRSFQDVFESFTSQGKMIIPENNATIQDRACANQVKLDDKNFNFNLFYHLLSPYIIARDKLTSQVEQDILKLVAIYSISEKDMVNFVYRALKIDGSVDIEKLRKIVRDSYQLIYKTLPTITVQKPHNDKRVAQDHESNKEEALAFYLENISPFQLLIDIGNGAKPAETDLKVIEEIMTSQNLPAPVMNVLIEYVTLRLDGKISRNYMMTIAAHWKRKNVKTAKEAMNLVFNEHEKYKRLKEEPEKEKKTNRRPNYKKNVYKEVLPDWFKSKEKTTTNKLSEEEKLALDKEIEEIKKQLEKER